MEFDFARAERDVRMRLLSGRAHYETVVRAVTEANHSVWIATANLKELMVEDGRAVPGRARTAARSGYQSVLKVFDELAKRKVELRILHATPPSRAFRAEFDRHPRLYRGGLQLRACPRVHLKAVVVDGGFLYLGSANWTGAGLGAKGTAGATSSWGSRRRTWACSTRFRRSSTGFGAAPAAGAAASAMYANLHWIPKRRRFRRPSEKGEQTPEAGVDPRRRVSVAQLCWAERVGQGGVRAAASHAPH